MQELFNILKEIFNDRVFIDARPNNSNQTDVVVTNDAIHVHALNRQTYYANIPEFNRVQNLLPKYLPIDTITHERNNDGEWYMIIKLFECEYIDIVLNELNSVSDGYGGVISEKANIYNGKASIVDLRVYQDEKGDRYNKLSTHKVFIPVDAKRNHSIEGYTTNEIEKNILYVTKRY